MVFDEVVEVVDSYVHVMEVPFDTVGLPICEEVSEERVQLVHVLLEFWSVHFVVVNVPKIKKPFPFLQINPELFFGMG